MKILTNIAVIIALMLLSVSGMQAAVPTTAPENPECNCCQGPCKGCCCSVPASEPDEQSGQSDNACNCELTELPNSPEMPMEVQNQQTNKQIFKSQYVDFSFIESSLAIGKSSINNDSPPDDKSPPAYVLFASFLI